MLITPIRGPKSRYTSWEKYESIYNPKLFIAFGPIGSRPRIIDMILSLELFIASGGLIS